MDNRLNKQSEGKNELDIDQLDCVTGGGNVDLYLLAKKDKELSGLPEQGISYNPNRITDFTRVNRRYGADEFD